MDLFKIPKWQDISAMVIARLQDRKPEATPSMKENVSLSTNEPLVSRDDCSQFHNFYLHTALRGNQDAAVAGTPSLLALELLLLALVPGCAHVQDGRRRNRKVLPHRSPQCDHW